MPVRLSPWTRLWSRNDSGKPGHEGVDPDREPRELDRDRVEVDAVDAAASDLAAEQARVSISTPSAERRAPEAAARSGRARPSRPGCAERQEPREARLDPIDGGDEEVPRTHRDVDAAEVEERLGGLRRRLLRRASADTRWQVVVERRFEGVVEQVLDRERLGEVRCRSPCERPSGCGSTPRPLDDGSAPSPGGDVVGALSIARSVGATDKLDSSSPS